jgi:hypothetical protein
LGRPVTEVLYREAPDKEQEPHTSAP